MENRNFFTELDPNPLKLIYFSKVASVNTLTKFHVKRLHPRNSIFGQSMKMRVRCYKLHDQFRRSDVIKIVRKADRLNSCNYEVKYAQEKYFAIRLIYTMPM